MIKRGFTLIELLVVTVIMGILTAMGLPIFESQKDKSVDAWSDALITNTTKILMADEFTNVGRVNFADLDRDLNYIGVADAVTTADINNRLRNQDYSLSTDNKGRCFLYGYESAANNHDDMLMIVPKGNKSEFIYEGTLSAVKMAENITAIDCTPGSEGVTGGTWTDYQWLNFIP